jgi:hypothetical protein
LTYAITSIDWVIAGVLDALVDALIVDAEVLAEACVGPYIEERIIAALDISSII